MRIVELGAVDGFSGEKNVAVLQRPQGLAVPSP